MEFSGSDTFADVGESVFSVVSSLAREETVIDLGQGYPSYAPPEELMDALTNVEPTPRNHQYAESPGRGELRRMLVRLYDELHDRSYDPDEEVTVTAGATEAIHAVLMGLLNQGDEVVLLEPVYDQYAPVIQRAGAQIRTVRLRTDYSLPVRELDRVIGDSTTLLLLNNPHNPTGTVFEKNSLQKLVHLAREHEVVLLSDEVYEHLYYEGAEHVPLAQLPGARERTLTVGSAGKSFDATGWKIGWIMGDAHLTELVRVAHQYITYCVSTPLQEALTRYLEALDQERYFREMRDRYESRRSILLEGLKSGPFEVRNTKGSYFVTASVPSDDVRQSDVRGKVQWLIDRFGVAAVPMDAFYRSENPEPEAFRFAFCKDEETLREAARRLK